MSRREGTVMWTKGIVLGAMALGAMVATSACMSAEEEPGIEAETGAAELAAGQFCGGIAGIPCPEAYTCVDDPHDSCDPGGGGADCGGVCVAEEPCGTVLCGVGQYCCNASCSLCAPEGGFCTQQVCVTDAG
jgi:hypothetical protein